MHAIETSELRKRYGEFEALHGIDLTVPTGALFGFLGPNGAGKTTALRILLGLLRSSGGRATVFGRDPWNDGSSVRAWIGYLPGDVRLFDRMTGRDTLGFFANARKCDAFGEIKRLAMRFDLDLSRKVREFSKGMKQKLGLIAALMHQPPLLILDEPSTGLDPLVQETLHAELRDAARRGQTVLFSSHTLKEVQDLCDRVAILRKGALIEQDSIEALRERAVRRVEIIFDDDQSAPRSVVEGLTVASRIDHRLTGSWIGPLPRLLKWLSDQSIADVTIAPPDLEDLFLAYYADPSEDGR